MKAPKYKNTYKNIYIFFLSSRKRVDFEPTIVLDVRLDLNLLLFVLGENLIYLEKYYYNKF